MGVGGAGRYGDAVVYMPKKRLGGAGSLPGWRAVVGGSFGKAGLSSRAEGTFGSSSAVRLARILLKGDGEGAAIHA